jgi:hypothetical protein
MSARSDRNEEFGRILEYGHQRPRAVSNETKGWLIAGILALFLLGGGTFLMYFLFRSFFSFSAAP